MKLNLFEVNKKQINQLDEIINNFTSSRINERTFNEMMKPVNISFSVEEGSRLLSHVVCESFDSYTQQSQRYVAVGDNAFVIPQEIKGTEFEDRYKNLMSDIFSFYNEMTLEKEGELRGRGSGPEKYVQGIPIEDGRYILPIAATTNVLVTMSGEKAINFVKLLKEHPQQEAHDLAYDFINSFEKDTFKTVLDSLSDTDLKDQEVIYTHFKPMFDKISKDEIVLFDRFQNPVHRVALGGVTSTHSKPPSVVYAKWSAEEADARAEKISNKVLGYGHESIAEHARVSFGTEQSLTSYHQWERHRLKDEVREPFEKIPINRKVFIPPTVASNNEMYDRFMTTVNETKYLRKELIDAGFDTAASYLLLNADGIKVITGSNARNDKAILEQRTCNCAQWEIRDRASAIQELLRDNLPYMYDRSGPRCTKGKCPEGELTCGQTVQMRERYGYFGPAKK
ncbi:MAG: FAD-dependent thymidylate synthase [Nanoarchaeota archaeon]|nr:FAD-dependent thymidylate synthase [Nanoarchaeota archaeon]